MSATGFLSDDVIEAIVDDRPVDPSPAALALATFAHQVRALGDGPAPRPSHALAALLAGSTGIGADRAETADTARLPEVATVERPAPPTVPTELTDVGGSYRSNGSAPSTSSANGTDLTGGRRPASRNGTGRPQLPAGSTRPTDPTKRLAAPVSDGARGRRRVAKVALGVAVAAAGVAGAGAVGILPAAANDAVRNAIEAVSPVHFADPGGGPTSSDDDRVSETPTTGDEGGTGGGTTIDDDATGADHRPDPSAAGEPPGQSGDTGLTRANETPAEPHAPASTPAATAPSTVPAHDPAGPAGTGSVPSTVPAARGGPTDDHNPDT